MCENCYIEAGSPEIINVRTKMVASMIEQLYELEGCGAGGYLHIITDDWNVRDSDIEFCQKECEKGDWNEMDWPEAKEISLGILSCLRQMSIEERISALAIHSGVLTTKN